MAEKKISVAGVARREKAVDTRVRKEQAKAKEKKTTLDSFVNFSQKLGVGADNALSTASYGFNPITRIRTMLEWVHRGSWLGGVAIDLVADDMTKAGVELLGELSPEDIEHIDEVMTHLSVWKGIGDAIKWSRLYGGSIAVIMIDGQKVETPLRIETIGKNAFKGVAVFDRWMVEPTLNDLVTEMGPEMGLPKFYRVASDAPSLRGMKIHHSRCIRLVGIELPYWQRVMENLWGISVIERLYDRMIAFDSATTGAAQLVYKAYIRTYKVKGLREVIASGGRPLEGLASYVDMMRRFMGQEGMTLIDSEDEMEAMQTSAFSGLSDALLQFGQQLAGALQIPLVRLFGQSPAGLNSTGESDLRMYYDNINQQQNRDLKVGVTKIYRIGLMSEGVKVPEGFSIKFKTLWQLTEEQKADIATKVTDAVTKAEDSGLISQQTAMEELKQSSAITGVFTNISDEDIEGAEESLPPAGEEALKEAQALGADPTAVAALSEGKGAGNTGLGRAAKIEKKLGEEGGDEKEDKKPKAKDSIAKVSTMKRMHDLDVVIENPKGSVRSGRDWEVTMPYDYGYLRNTVAPDGEGVDCMLGPNCDSGNVFIVDQVKLDTKEPDEPKVMFGYADLKDALSDFLQGYSDGRGWDRVGGVRETDMKSFKDKVLPGWRRA